MNVRMWLASRKARAPLARHLLRILGMLEARYRFRTLAFYIRTYHNVTADWVSYGRRRWRSALDACMPPGVVVDMPDKGPKESVIETLRTRGYGVKAYRVRCTDFGDAVAKVKWLVVGLQARTVGGEAPHPTAVEVNGIDKVVHRGNASSTGRPFEGEVILSSRISTSGDRMLPWPAGHAKGAGLQRKQLVYDIRGPALTPRREGEMLVVDYQQKGCPVRHLTVEEEWLANGGSRTQIQQARMRGMTDSDLKKETLRCMPQRTAHHMMGWLERMRRTEADSKVGVCRDEDRRKMDEVVRVWLQAWRGTPGRPRQEFERMISRSATDKVGGAAKRRRPGSAPPGGDVRPVALGRSRERMVLDANLQLSKDKAWLDALATEAIMSKLSEGSRASYEVGWRQWCVWRRVQAKNVYLQGVTREEKKEDEDDMLRFLTFLTKVMNRAEGTVRQRLFALKMGHVVAGYEDPTLHRTRLWAALTGFKRWQPEVQRKYPVLPCMMRWMKCHIDEVASFSKGDKVALWAALVTAFFFLLRASEYLVQANRSWSVRRVLKGCEVEGRTSNQTSRIQNAQEVVIYLAGSKTDQYNQGTIRNHYRSGDPVLCPVRALGEMERYYPERFRGAEAEEPLFRFEDGMPIGRDDIHGLVQLAAVADGQEGARFGSHSLRIGGATALYQGTKDLEQVKRFGRWTSDAFHGYLWENHERQRGLSARMARADGQLLAPRKDELRVKVGESKDWREEGPHATQTRSRHPSTPDATPKVLQSPGPIASREATSPRNQQWHGNQPKHRSHPTRRCLQDSVAQNISNCHNKSHGGQTGVGGGCWRKGCTTDKPDLPSDKKVVVA